MVSPKKRVALIGAGNIANFHVPALRAAGLEVAHCASSINSKTVDSFALKHNINHVWNDPIKLLESYDLWDGVIISASVNSTLELLKEAIKSSKPILVEKPVALKSVDLINYKNHAPSNVLVAYNRRHYSTVALACKFVSDRNMVRATMTLPENVSSEMQDPYYRIHENTVHGLDMLNYIFGGVVIEHVSNIDTNNNFFGRHALLRSKLGHLISLLMNWKAPTNYSLSIDDSIERLDLLPFEKFQKYHGMKVVEPSDEYPVRQYVPNMIGSGSVFDGLPTEIKPGFLGQAKEFASLINGGVPRISATLTDAYNAQLLAENLIYHDLDNF